MSREGYRETRAEREEREHNEREERHRQQARRALKPGIYFGIMRNTHRSHLGEWACVDAKCAYINPERYTVCGECGKGMYTTSQWHVIQTDTDTERDCPLILWY